MSSLRPFPVLAGLLAVPQIFALGGPASGQCIEYGDYLHPVSVLDGGGAGLAASDSYVYVAGWGLQVLDVSDPWHPGLASRLDTPNGSMDVALSGRYAHVSGRSAFRVMDIADPLAPRIVGSVETPGEGWGVVIRGDRAYVADGPSGLLVIDVQYPESPRILGSVDTPRWAQGVALSGDHAYVADSNSLQIVDVADPAHPTIVGQVELPGEWTYAVAVMGDLAYVACGDGLQVLDIANPGQPLPRGFLSTRESAGDVVVVGDRAYVAVLLDGLEVIDIADPDHPRSIECIVTPNAAAYVAVADGYAYVTDVPYGDGDGGGPHFNVINIGNSLAPSLLSQFEIAGYPAAVAVAGTYAYVAEFDSALRVIDVADVHNPRDVGRVVLPEWQRPFDVSIVGDYAYIAAYYSLQIVDIRNPETPTVVGMVDSLQAAARLAVSGGYAYVVDGYEGLRVIDISTPQNAHIVGTLNTHGAASSVAVATPYAYVGVGQFGLLVVDISVPADPRVVGGVDTPGSPRGMALSGTHLMIAEGYPWDLTVVDVTDPENPRVAASLQLPGHSQDVTVSGSKAYLASYGGAYIVDIANPLLPRLVGSPVGWSTHDVAVSSSAIFLVDPGALWILPPSCPEATPVALLSFTAIQNADGVRLDWVTAGETDHAGFHVYRGTAGGPQARITGDLLTGGPTYRCTDRGAGAGRTYEYELEAVSRSGGTERVGRLSIEVPVAAGLALKAMPNPSTGATRITYTLPESGPVTVRVFDLSGRLIRTLKDGIEPAGPNDTAWDATDDAGKSLPSGIYFVHVKTGSDVGTQRFMIAR